MKVNRTTAIATAIALGVIAALALWGHLLGLDPDTLDAVRSVAAGLGVLATASLRSILTRDEDGDGIPDVLQKLLSVIPLVFLLACGAGAVQTAISAQASVIVATRPARVDYYAAIDAGCQAAPDLAAYRECMAPARHVARAADSYRETLFAAQAALDASEDGTAPGAVACAIVAAQRLVAALDAAHVPIPAEVSTVAALVPEGVCGE